MSRALKELFGQFDWVQRSSILVYVGLEQGADQLYISPVRATQVKGSILPNHLERRSAAQWPARRGRAAPPTGEIHQARVRYDRWKRSDHAIRNSVRRRLP